MNETAHECPNRQMGNVRMFRVCFGLRTGVSALLAIACEMRRVRAHACWLFLE